MIDFAEVPEENWGLIWCQNRGSNWWSFQAGWLRERDGISGFGGNSAEEEDESAQGIWGFLQPIRRSLRMQLRREAGDIFGNWAL